jgi:hypothetical protein
MFTLLFVFLFILLVLLHLDAVLLLKLLESQRVGHESLVSSLFLLFDSEQRIFSNLGGDISGAICELYGNEVLVRGTDLQMRISRYVAWNRGVNSPCRSRPP